MKFANVLRGKKATNPVTVPGFTIEDDKPWVVLMRPITGLEYEAACADARARAIEKGVKEPAVGDPIYDLALQAFILARGCEDPDSPEEARTPVFESGVQILKDMNPEMIVYLHEHHEIWQDACSPYVTKLDGDQIMSRLKEVAGPDGLTTFMRFSPSMRVNFAISTARTLSTLLAVSSTPGFTSEDTSKASESAPPTNDLS